MVPNYEVDTEDARVGAVRVTDAIMPFGKRGSAPAKKSFSVRVTTMDAELEFNIEVRFKFETQQIMT